MPVKEPENEYDIAVRHWVGVASSASHAISLIEGYQEALNEYLDWCEATSNPPAKTQFNAIARAALPVLDLAFLSLVLFCTRACEASTFNLITLANKAIRELPPKSGARTFLKREKEAFVSLYSERQAEIRGFRNKVVAHSSSEFVLGRYENDLTVKDVIAVSSFGIHLIENIAGVGKSQKIGEPSHPSVSDNRLVVLHEKFAHYDARAFWKSQFMLWDANYM